MRKKDNEHYIIIKGGFEVVEEIRRFNCGKFQE